MDDVQLLRQYVKDGSQEAFAEIVRRHVDLVYGTARRLVGDEQLAEDVAQAAFMVLAQKAKRVEPGRRPLTPPAEGGPKASRDATGPRMRRPRRRCCEAMRLRQQGEGVPAGSRGGPNAGPQKPGSGATSRRNGWFRSFQGHYPFL